MPIGWQGCLGLGAGLLLASSLAQESQLGHGGQPHGQAKLCHRERSHIKYCLVGLKKDRPQVGGTGLLSKLLQCIRMF